jgi:uncharacterized protein with beta-barrel porin domain
MSLLASAAAQFRAGFARSAFAAIALAASTVGQFAATATAQCAPANPPDGATVTCTNATPGGFGNGNNNNLTINVQAGATIGTAGTLNAINVDDGNVINNLGTLTALGTGVNAFDAVTVNNSGQITVVATGGGLLNVGVGVSGVDVTVTNTATGLITASGSLGPNPLGPAAIQAGDNAIVVNAGTVTANGFSSTGIFAGTFPSPGGGNANVMNSGTISTIGDSSEAIFAVNIATVTSSGTISASGPGAIAIQGDSAVTLNNSGAITGSAFAIAAFGCGCSGPGTANVTNSGTILSTGANSVAIGADEVILANSGSVIGKLIAIQATDSAKVTNSGTISGSLFAIQANNQITLDNSGTILATSAAAGATAIDTNGTAQITNSGLISGLNGIFVGGNGVIGQIGQFGATTGRATAAEALVTNVKIAAPSVTVSSRTSSVVSDIVAPMSPIKSAKTIALPSSVTNSGTISATGGFAVVMFGDNSSVINNGTISTNSPGPNFGIDLVGNSTAVVNNGLIQDLGPNGSPFSIVATGNANTVTNNGAIIMHGQIGQALNSFGNNSTITNNGALQSFGRSDWGFYVLGDQNLVVNAGNYIGAGLVNDEGIVVAGIGNRIVNSGKITVIGQDGAGIDVTGLGGAPNTVLNSGTIIASAGSGAVDPEFPNVPAVAVFLSGSGTVFTNAGTVIAGAGALSIQDNNLGFPTDHTSVINTGTVDGLIDLSHGTHESLTNSGLITISYLGPVLQHVVGDAATNSGSFTQTAAGTLALRLLPNGTSDQLIVNGTANLGGTLKAVLQPGLFYDTTIYKGVVDPPVINGTFAQTLTNSFFFTATAIYNAASVDLNLRRIAFNAFPGLTRNEFAVGTALENAYSIGVTGAARTLYSELFVALSVPPAQAYDMLGGEGTTATQQTSFDAQKLFSHSMGGQATDWATGGAGLPNQIVLNEPSGPAPLAYADGDLPYGKYVKGLREQAPPVATARTWRLWANAFAGVQDIDGLAFPTGSAPVDIHNYGAAVGADYQLNPNFLVGAAAGGSGSNFSVAPRLTSGTVEGLHAGIYGAARWNAFYASAGLSYGRFSNSVRRGIIGIGPNEIANGKFDSAGAMGRLELGYRQALASFVVTPFVALEAGGLRQGGFTETDFATAGGFGVLGLTYRSKTAVTLPASLGAQIETTLTMPYGISLTPFARLAWVHEFRPERNLGAAFTVLPAALFTIDGARVASDALEVKTGAKLKLSDNSSLFANFDGEFAGRSRSYTGTAGFNYTW